ncbi:MAG: N-6 DNA methylase [Gemmatimonadaceae bacterium]|nr:N-6 DNA methylase [Gemmatimonadaceae bacterium]
MLTTIDAAKLLSAPRDGNSLCALGEALGFRATGSLARRECRRLGLPEDIAAPRLGVGANELRALYLRAPAAQASRDALARLCKQVAWVAPEFGWLILVDLRESDRLVVAVPPLGGSGSVAALEVARRSVTERDAETFAALAGAAGDSTLARHRRWREILGRDALSQRFYREFERGVGALADSSQGRATPDERRTIALLHASRLLFVAFLEARGWLNGDREFLRQQFTLRSGGRGAHRRMLEPLWFGTLNTPLRRRAPDAKAFGRLPFLNGGLFTRTPLERRLRHLALHDNALGDFIHRVLGGFRLTAREQALDWSDAAVDPEMLGRTFESLMHPATRKSRGTFYTPPAMLGALTSDGLAAALEHATLADLRICDPACGSGAFLVHALDRLSALWQAGGDNSPPTQIRRRVATQQIFGVDIDPIAVWLCQLRLWLAVIVDDPASDPAELQPLPNLDRNVREGDALAGDAFAHAATPTGRLTAPPLGSALAISRLRERYARTTGARKRTLARTLDREERKAEIGDVERRLLLTQAQRRDLLSGVRSPTLFSGPRTPNAAAWRELAALRLEARRLRARLERLRDGAALRFGFASHFPHIAREGGFGLVLGNPPWVRPHAVEADERARLRERFQVFRSAPWEAGAAGAGAGRGFAGQADLAALFTERALHLARPGGAIALLLPAKLWSSLAGGGVRALLTDSTRLRVVDDWSEASQGFDAVTYPSGLVATRVEAQAAARPSDGVKVRVRRDDDLREWKSPAAGLALDDTAGAPWLLLPPAVRAAFDLLASLGTPLHETAFGRPTLGVKSGCNAAFVLARHEAARLGIDAGSVRPLLRGEDLAPWKARPSESRIIWTHDRRGAVLETLPSAVHRHLRRWRHELERRSDARGARWWSLYRTESARSDRPRVVWGDIGKQPRALVLPRGDRSVPLNTCYAVFAATEDDAHALAVLLNSAIGTAWLAALAEPARGGYRRFLGWTCARFPLPRDWPQARTLLATLGAQAAAGSEPPTPREIDEQVLAAYGVEESAISALLAWNGC